MDQEIISKLNDVKMDVINLAQANNSPSVNNIARQALDALDTAYLFYSSLVSHIAHRDQQVEQAVASGKIVPFPFPGAADVP